MAAALIAGAATADITPDDSQFLFGYPHVRRYSTGVHDPLLSSALFLSDGKTPLLLVANDVIYVSRKTARRVRDRIAKETGIPAANMMITATHTHSGPLTADTLSNEGDAAVPQDRSAIRRATGERHRRGGGAGVSQCPAGGDRLRHGRRLVRRHESARSRGAFRSLRCPSWSCAIARAGRLWRRWSSARCTRPCCTRIRRS